MTARIGDHFGLDDDDRCPDCGHMPGCWCVCCMADAPPHYLPRHVIFEVRRLSPKVSDD